MNSCLEDYSYLLAVLGIGFFVVGVAAGFVLGVLHEGSK